jgi:hypothetical protein
VENQHSSGGNSSARPLWAQPWKYTESFIIVIGIVVLGIVLGGITRGADIKPVSAPYNIYIVFLFWAFLIFFHINYRKKAIGAWVSGVPSAICAIALFALLILLMGIIPQENENSAKWLKLMGLTHIKTSWIFQLAQVYFLTALGMVTLRRSFPLKGRNIGFFLSHSGLLLTLTAALLGAGDVMKLHINLLEKGEESGVGISGQGEIFNLPFTVRLLDFSIEEYNPKLAVVDHQTGEIRGGVKQKLPVAEKGLKTDMSGWQLEIVDYLPQAMIKDSTVQASDERGSYPAAKVKALRIGTKDTLIGWITSGSYLQNAGYLALDSMNVLVLTSPEPKKFSSLLAVTSDSMKVDTVMLEVNKPITVKGWKIYQMSYDESKGRWSSLSVLEAVSDPWLPVVYSGLFMLMAGAVYLLLIRTINN